MALKKILFYSFLFSALTTFSQIPSGYYNGTESLSGDALKTALHNIIDGHQAQSYASLWTHFYTTDDKINGKVWDMYSDIPNGTPPYEYTFGSNQCGNYNSEGDCYNREHSMPKSWYNDASPMYSDLFHLVPTDGYVNGKRGSLPYGEVGSANWTSLNGSKKGTCNYPGYSGEVFEPIDEYKGDLARGYLYMEVRYKDQIGSWNSPMLDGNDGFTNWAINLLLDWHEQDPVSQKEINRNNAIYGIQNNRNPFIDHPEFANLIWGNVIYPTISNISIAPTNPTPAQSVSVSATITDDGSVSSAYLMWGLSSGNLTNGPINMHTTKGVYVADSDIPQQANGTTVYFKVSATDNESNTSHSMEQAYTVEDPTMVTLSVNPNVLNSFSYTLGNGPSANKTFTVDAENLTANVNIAAPAHYEISGSNSGSFGSTLSLTPSSGNIINKTVYVRLKSGLAVGSYNNEEVLLSSSGVPNQTVSCSGSVNAVVVGGGMENFVNYPETGSSYKNGAFVGQDGSTWNYLQCRGDIDISSETPCLGKNRTPTASMKSGIVHGGIGTINFNYMQAFSTDVNLNVYVNNSLIGNVTSNSEQNVVKNSGELIVNVAGDFDIRFEQASSSAGQVAIDNIEWTGYSSCVNDSIISYKEICEGQDFMGYTSEGVYYYSIPKPDGCDSVFELHLTVNDTLRMVEFEEICSGESISWQGNTYSSEGIYLAEYANINGCDSIYELHLNEVDAFYYTENQSICEGDSLFWQGDFYSEEGFFTRNYQTIHGCDSSYHLNLSINANPIVYLGNDTSIYDINSLTLDAGEGFQSYQWHDLSENQTFWVDSTVGLGEHIAWVAVSDSNNCYASDTISITIVHFEKVSNVELARSIKVYPNPAKDMFYIKSDDSKIIALKILDLNGQLLANYNEENCSNGISLETLDNGMYLVKILTNQGYLTFKIIKE